MHGILQVQRQAVASSGYWPVLGILYVTRPSFARIFCSGYLSIRGHTEAKKREITMVVNESCHAQKTEEPYPSFSSHSCCSWVEKLMQSFDSTNLASQLHCHK
ncbi:hypothetical protein PoB_000824000 [Plakobranchus ocellatus]|uniref:Uncharacterized protein n=1 Tax=Plakobranchus ocellatus TaxID=259542 RepID=A0AAV3YG87_9GAST|nr:hypothetical protein PoB_000824000 [Plakobranchus ocellatus]